MSGTTQLRLVFILLLSSTFAADLADYIQLPKVAIDTSNIDKVAEGVNFLKNDASLVIA